MPQEELQKLLKGLTDNSKRSSSGDESEFSFLGIGLDSCVLPTRHKNIQLVQTTDFFYPLVDDPYIQGRIACANVLSDLYATGVTECDNMLMLLGISNDMSHNERQVATQLVIEGFNDAAKQAGTTVNGGQTVLNPWFIIGGVATSIVKREEVILPDQAVTGDVIVLTKPLGTQVAVNAHQWVDKQTALWDKIKGTVTEDDVEKAYQASMESMSRLNLNAARLMHKYQAHCSTDVTGFGILGHAANLAENQKANVDLVLHTLPIISKMRLVSDMSGVNFKLLQGYSAETSGGLLVCLPKEQVDGYISELEKLDGSKSWIIGDVVEGNKSASLSKDIKVLEV